MTLEEYGRRRVKQLKALKWRFRFKEVFLHAMELLDQLRWIQGWESVTVPLNLYNSHPDVDAVVKIPSCFDMLYECSKDDTEPRRHLWEKPVYWLAITICRSTSSASTILPDYYQNNITYLSFHIRNHVVRPKEKIHQEESYSTLFRSLHRIPGHEPRRNRERQRRR